MIFITLDLIELIETSIDVHDGSKSKHAEKIRDLVKKLEMNKNEIVKEFADDNEEADEHEIERHEYRCLFGNDKN